MNEPASTINYYQTISPDMVLRQREKIAKWVFNIRDPKEAELIITNQGFLYFERNYHYYKDSRRSKQEIASKKEAEMILRKHADNFNKKMQATLSGDPMNPVAVTYFRWEHFKLERLNPKIGSIVDSWEAFLYAELPSIQKVGLQTREKSGVTGESIRVEFTTQEIIQLQYDHLPVIRSASTRLIQTDKNGKKMINSVFFQRTTPSELFPYYYLGGRLIPAIENKEEIVLFTNTIYDLPTPKIIGNPEAFIQILGGQGSDYKQGIPGLVNMQLNLSFLIVAGKNKGRFQPEMIQAGQIQSLLERTIQTDLNGLVLTSCPMPGKPLFYRILESQKRLHASEYYRLSLSSSVSVRNNPEINFLSAFSWTGFPSASSKVILCLNPEWPDTETIKVQLAEFGHYRKLVLDSIFRKKRKPIVNQNLRKVLNTISTFCHIKSNSLCILNFIEERVEIYKNSILVVGRYFYIETESDDWLKEKLNEYGILLFPDMATALQDGPSGMTILDIQNEMDLRSLFEISKVVSEVMKADLLTLTDFEYRFHNKIVKHYHICQLYGTSPVIILNPALRTENNIEITCGILKAVSGIDSSRSNELGQITTVKECLLNCFN